MKIIVLVNRCTNPQWWGCERTGSPTNILNPIKSARIRTVNSFSFRYGRVEVRAKMPAGDWLWPGKPSYDVIPFEIIVSSYIIGCNVA